MPFIITTPYTGITSWDAYFPEVRPFVPGCPTSMVRDAIRNAAIDFCEKTLIWTGLQDQINVYESYNYIVPSEDFNDIDWVKTGTTVSPDTGFGPDDAATTDTINGFAGGDEEIRYQVKNVNPSGQTWSFSVHLLGTVGDTITIGIGDGLSGGTSSELEITLTAALTRVQVPHTFGTTYGKPTCYIVSRAGNTATSLNAWGAQAEPTATAGTYRGTLKETGLPQRYEFTPPDEAIVTKIMEAWHDGDPLTPKSPAELFSMHPNWRTETGTPNYITQDDQYHALLVPIPTVAVTNGLVMNLALKPTRDSTNGPDLLYDNYLEVIAAGAKVKLMTIPEKAWTNPQLAAYNKSVFDGAVNSALIAKNHGLVNSDLRVTPRRFA